MKAEHTVNRIRGALADHLIGFDRKDERRVFIEIGPESVLEAGSVMFEEIGARLQIATGVDTPQGIEVLYHWALDAEDCLVTVRVTVAHEQPELESIANFCPAAEWIEREIWELLGIEFLHHPDLRHLLLDDDWREGDYPLRKDYRGPGPLPRHGSQEALEERLETAGTRESEAGEELT